METGKISVVSRGWGKGGMNRQSMEDLHCCDAVLYDIMMMDTSHYIFIQTHRIYSTKNEP